MDAVISLNLEGKIYAFLNPFVEVGVYHFAFDSFSLRLKLEHASKRVYHDYINGPKDSTLSSLVPQG